MSDSISIYVAVRCSRLPLVGFILPLPYHANLANSSDPDLDSPESDPMSTPLEIRLALACTALEPPQHPEFPHTCKSLLGTAVAVLRPSAVRPERSIEGLTPHA